MALAPELARWQRRHSDELTIAVVERASNEIGEGADAHGRRDLLVQRDSDVADVYVARGTPSAVLVDTHGRVASAPVGGRVGIEALVAEHVAGFESSERASESTPPTHLRRREILTRFGVASGALAALGFPAWATAQAGPLKIRRCHHDRDCPGSLQCIDGDCKCPALYLDQCGNDCVDLNGDPANCRECDHACGAGESCVGGKCTEGDATTCNPPCPVGQACCLESGSPKCVDLSVGAGEHCGECGHDCTPTEVCCDGRCKNLFQNPNRCTSKEEGCFGVNKKKCKRGQVCFNGRCRDTCPDRYTRCGDFCLDSTRKEQCCDARVYGQWDLHNCGACGHDCKKLSGFIRAACCPGVGCVDLAVNPGNCGGCGNPCPSNCQCVPGPGGKGVCTNCV
ncbi:MAG: hypothetical protein U0R26_00495 [Solirubrobacterales bacterium]